MIYTQAKVTIRSDNQASINREIVLYRGDKNVEIQFEIVESLYRQYKFDGSNTILNLGASYGQLVIQKPDNTYVFSAITPTKDGYIIFVLTEDMIDESMEVGPYTFQIRLFDETQNSRVTLPPVVGGIVIIEPIANE